MTNLLNIKFETAVRFLAEHLPPAEEKSRKPILFHDIRVGVYLYENGYAKEIVLAGILHDAIEWAGVSEETLRKEFGENVAKLVAANTKDDSISSGEEKTEELIKRCAQNSQDALMIKAADITDSSKWYEKQNNQDELRYCMRNTDAIFKFKPDSFNDKIFSELKTQQQKFSSLSK